MVMTKLNTEPKIISDAHATQRNFLSFTEHFKWSKTCTTRNQRKKQQNIRCTMDSIFVSKRRKKKSRESMVPITIFHCIRNDSMVGFFFILSFRRFAAPFVNISALVCFCHTKLNDTLTSSNYTVFCENISLEFVIEISHKWFSMPCLFNARRQFVCVC